MFDITESAPLTQGWRSVLKVHPVAGAFPLLSKKELEELAGDIQRNGLKTPIVLWAPEDGAEFQLLDGRNRLDALEMIGHLVVDEHGRLHEGIEREPIIGGDPKKLAYSLNVHCRHLTTEQKRDLILRLLMADPEKSDLAIAKQAKVVSDKTVIKIRKGAVARSEIPDVKTRTDSKGRKQPARKAPKAKAAKPGAEHNAEENVTDPEASAEARKQEFAALDAGDAAPAPKPLTRTDIVNWWDAATPEDRRGLLEDIGIDKLRRAMPPGASYKLGRITELEREKARLQSDLSHANSDLRTLYAERDELKVELERLKGAQGEAKEPASCEMPDIPEFVRRGPDNKLPNTPSA